MSENLYEKPFMLWKVLPDTPPQLFKSETTSSDDESEDSDYALDEDEEEDEAEEEEEFEQDEWNDPDVDLQYEIDRVDMDDEYYHIDDLSQDEMDDSDKEWRQSYHEKNQQYLEKYGCPIDTLADPEAFSKLRQLKQLPPQLLQSQRWSLFKVCSVFVVLIACGFQWYLWSLQLSPNMSVSSTSFKCSTSLLQIVYSRHDADHQAYQKSGQKHCTAALERSTSANEKIHALIERGDVQNSVYAFDAAEKDYLQAIDLLSTTPNATLVSLLYGKYYRTRWVHLYVQNEFELLQRELELFRMQALPKDKTERTKLLQDTQQYIALLTMKSSSDKLTPAISTKFAPLLRQYKKYTMNYRRAVKGNSPK